MSFEKGANVGPYRIIEQLGQGGMATVYKAYHPALDRYVAIKVLHQAFKEDPNFLARFQREARVVAKIDHPNIVPVYDFSEHEEQPYLVMKFVEGETLKARLQRAPLSREEALSIIDATGSALDYAHRLGILHRDIKPSNVLIAEDGDVYLADFGLARIAQRGTSTLSSDVMLGTPQYISPEQARGESDLDNGTDIYSFGVVLYEMVVGRVPFNADTPFSIIHDHIYTPLPLPHSLNPKVPEGVERVLLKALAKDRNDRFETVGALVQAFKDAVAGKPLDLGEIRPDMSTMVLVEDAAPQPVKRPRKRRPWLWIAAGLLIGLLSLIGFLSALNEAQLGRALNALENEPLPQERLSSVDQAGVDALRSEIAELERTDPMEAAIRAVEVGHIYMQSGNPLEAGRAYLEALLLSEGDFLRDPAFTERFLESLFFAAENPGSVELFTQLRRTYPGWRIVIPLQARGRLLNDNVTVAERLLFPYREENPDEPIGMAVEAELLLLQGDPDTAEALLLEIREQPLFDWLRKHLEMHLNSF